MTRINTSRNTTRRKQYLSLALGGFVLCDCLASATFAQAVKAKSAQAKPAAVKKSLTIVVVQGKIKAIAKTPRPGSVPYKDAITAIHLTHVKLLHGKLMQSAILVYVWGLRSNKLTPAASYKVGQTIKFALQPWDKVEGKYGRYQRSELSDDATFHMDAFWGEVTKGS